MYSAGSQRHAPQSYACTFRIVVHDANDARNTYEASKKLRMSAHLVVQDADIAIYIDENVKITDEDFVKNIVNHHAEHRWDLLMCPHANTFTEELERCRQKLEYSSEGLDIQRRTMTTANKLCWSGFNARWLRSPLSKHVNYLMDAWWFLVKMDPFGFSNDELCFPKALELARTALRPINFSCDWTQECFFVHPPREYLIVPLEDGVPRERVRIYILCYSHQTLESAKIEFRKYHWARPIMLEHQDASFENVFYKQLATLDDWDHLDMVGTLAHSAHAKMDVYKLHCYIESGAWRDFDYVHFLKGHDTVFSHHSKSHGPVFTEAWENLFQKFGSKWNPPESYCNYWMCRPAVMKKFTEWHTQVLDYCFKTPLFLKYASYHSKLSKDELMRLCGVPHYPILPFVLERFNIVFFEPYKRKMLKCGMP